MTGLPGMSGATGAPRPTLLNPASAPGGTAVEHDIDTTASSAASVTDAPVTARLFGIL